MMHKNLLIPQVCTALMILCFYIPHVFFYLLCSNFVHISVHAVLYHKTSQWTDIL